MNTAVMLLSAACVIQALLLVWALRVLGSTQKTLEQVLERMHNRTERMITILVEMREKGFTTIPEDDAFGSYALTPEMEAAIERDRQEGIGKGVQQQVGDHPLGDGWVGVDGPLGERQV